MTTRRRLRFHGRVQGVGFRMSVRRAAVDAGIAGWVRNLPDGTVEAELEGAADLIDTVVEALRSHGGGARVDRVEQRTVPVRAATGFEIR